MDVSWRDGKGTYAGVERNSKGKCLEAWVGKTVACSPLVAEALAVRRAVEVYVLHKMHKVIIEGDAKVIIEAVTCKTTTLNWEYSQIIHDIKALIKNMVSSKFCFLWVNRQGNMAAHMLVKWGESQSFFGFLSPRNLPHCVSSLVLTERP